MKETINSILARMETGHILTKNGDRYSPSTVQNFRNVLPWIDRFQNSDPVGFRQAGGFSEDYFGEFQVWLMSQGLAKNTVAVMLQNLHAILRHEKTISVPPLETVKTELTTAVYNSREEVEFLTTIDLQETPGYDRARDAYVMHCNLGLRFGDFRKVMRNISKYIVESKGKRFFCLKTGKAGEDVVIPINRSAEAILAKRNADFGQLFSLQYYNECIKWVGKRAGFNAPIIKYITRGGRMTEEFYDKWQLMSSHTARRTFATNAWLAGVPESDIMKITGHRSVQAFKRYLRADALRKAQSLADHPFFR